jgi:MraZ protein
VINLIGTYECKIDAKGRVMLPSALKKQLLPILEKGFVLKRSVFQPCLEMYPMNEWDEVMEKIGKLNRFDRKNNDFIRRLTAGLKIIDLDASGRMLVAKDLLGYAGLEKEIVISSAGNILEVWDKNKYETAINDATIDFADLAEEVMGDKKDEFNGIS